MKYSLYTKFTPTKFKSKNVPSHRSQINEFINFKDFIIFQEPIFSQVRALANNIINN